MQLRDLLKELLVKVQDRPELLDFYVRVLSEDDDGQLYYLPMTIIHTPDYGNHLDQYIDFEV